MSNTASAAITPSQISKPQSLFNANIKLERLNEVISEAGFRECRIVTFKQRIANKEVFSAAISKDMNTPTLIAQGFVSHLQSSLNGETMILNDVGLEENSKRGFISNKVTGESFLMSEVVGAGSIRLHYCPHPLDCKFLQKVVLNVPNVNSSLVQALVGEVEISKMRRLALPTPFIYTIINIQSAMLISSSNVAEVNCTPGSILQMDAQNVAFWIGDLKTDIDPSNPGFIIFEGTGKVYAQISSSVSWLDA